MLTADTITDEQIRELRDQARANWGLYRLNPSAQVICDAGWALGESRWMDGIDSRTD